MVITGQRVCTAISRVARQGIHKEVKQFSLRRDIQFGVGVFTMQFDGFCRDAQFVGYESRAVAKEPPTQSPAALGG